MITGTRHCGGGVKKLISLFGLLIAVAFFNRSRKYVQTLPADRQGWL
jgi:hypothetical protein